MKQKARLLAMILIIFITACSSNDIKPTEKMDAFVNHWNEENFTAMYDMLSKETTETYPTEQFIDRYEKIYKDLNITNLKVTYEAISEEELEEAMNEGVATFPIVVEMESIAGPIQFNYEATLIQEGEKEEKDWFVQWDSGFIFPEMKDGGEINIRSELPSRGEILDRNKMPLALNDIAYEIGIVPEKLGTNANAEQVKQKVAQLLNMSIQSIDSALNADWVKPDLFVPLKKVPKTQENTLSQLWELDSIMGREATGRIYPLGEAAAHLIGYVGQITAEELEEQEPGTYRPNDAIGKSGLEKLYESRLKGTKGTKIVVTKEGEDEIVIAEIPVQNGENISLTIDANIQEEIFNSYGEDSGTAAAIDPKTGEALALVSSPAFNPNEMVYGITQTQWDKLQNDPRKPLINRFTSTYAPGSVIKPISAAIGIENGTLKPNEGLEINGLTWSNGKGWGDYEVRRVSSSSKPVDLTDALFRSDNIYFAMQAVKMGASEFEEGLKQFGFEEDFPFEYAYTKSTISSTGKLEDEVAVANTSYGQAEVEMSALHLAIAYTTFLNNGNMLKPTLVISEETSQIWHENLLTPDQANLMQDILRGVVEKGTAKAAQIEGYPISGKTGTAELKLSNDQSGRENGWFVGYPTVEQDILIAMMMENVQDKGASSYVAKIVAQSMYEMSQ